MSDNIPLEIQVEITRRLPVKSLIQFRSVSKVWKSVIDSADFIADYTLHSHARPQHLLIRYDDFSFETTYVSVVDDNTFPQNKFSPTVPLSIKLLWKSSVVGSSHGLLCVFGCYWRKLCDFGRKPGTEMAVIWNPSIRKSVAVVVPDVYARTSLGFGVCPATSDPKILKINDKFVEVYSLSSGAWRRASGNLSDKLVEVKWCSPEVTIDRFIYWFGVENLTSDGEFHLIIISFDLSTEEFREISLPVELAFLNPKKLFLCKRSDSLAVIKETIIMKEKYEVWIMENGVSKSFMKLFTVNMPNELVNATTLPLECRRNGELIMTISGVTPYSNELVVYEPLSEHMNNLGINGEYGYLFVSSYTESLILLDKENISVDVSALFDEEGMSEDEISEDECWSREDI